MEILVLFGLILLNGLFALTEIAVIASRTARLQEQAYDGSQGALDALKLKESPNRFLSTIQIGITLIGTLSGAFGGVAVAEDVTALLAQVPFLEPYASALGMGTVVVAITYFSLVLGELAPKRLGLTAPETLAIRLAPLMVWLSRLTSPLVVLLTTSTEGVLKVLGVRQEMQPPVTDEEIRLLMAEGTQAGIFEKLESEMVGGILRMGDQRARTVMTPRHEIVWLDLEDPLEETLARVRDSGYSRFPLCRGSLDNVIGMVYAKDLLSRYLSGQPIDLTARVRQPIYMPEGRSALEMLERFRTSRVHVALVLDEYGGVEGLITLRDLMEGIVGQILSAGEVSSPGAVQRSDGSWLVDGDYPADALEQFLGLRELPERTIMGYETVAGMMLALLDRIPSQGDAVTWEGWSFEVVDMDGLRIDKLMISAVPEGSG